MLMSEPALSSKLDDIVKEFSMLIKATNETLKQLDTWLATLEQLQSTNPSASRVKNVADSEPISNQGKMPSGASDNSNHNSISIERAVKDALDREKRKSNVIIFNMSDKNLLRDD